MNNSVRTRTRRLGGWLAAATIAVMFGFLSAARVRAAVAAADHGDAYRYYLRALLSESQGNLVAASEDLDRAIAIAPDSAYLYRTAAELSLRLNQVNKASDQIEKAVQLDPDDVKSLILSGQIAWALGDPDKAEKTLKRAVELDPDGAEALVTLAGALTPKKPGEAINLYLNFLKRHPNEVDIQERLAQLYQANGDLDKAEKAWNKALELSPGSLRAHLALAQIAEVQYATATAMAHYEAVINSDPDNLALLLRVGELRYRNNEMAKAYEAFSKAQTIAPTSASVNFWLALLNEHEGKWNEAIDYLKRIPMTGPDPGILLRLSYYYSQAGRQKEAIKSLEQLAASDPSNADFQSYLGMAYEQDKQFTKAEKTFQHLAELRPDDPEAHFQLASLHDRMGQFPKAEDELKAAIKLKPDFAMALNYLGYSYADRGINLPEAEKLVSLAVGIEPENAAYLDSMGWVYYKEGKFQKAADFLREAGLRGNDPLIWEHLGDAELGRGDPSAAVLAWDDTMRLDPDNRKVRNKIRDAVRKLTKRDRFSLFVKRALNSYGDIKSVNGMIKVTVCEKGSPCFESNARFSYLRDDEMRVEIPGPLSGPLMLLTKKHGQPSKYGAIHPQFQTVEFYVTRAFDNLADVLSADAFRNADLNSMAESLTNERGRLVGASDAERFSFSDPEGALLEIWSREASGGSKLSLEGKEIRAGAELPATVRWADDRTGFNIRVDFLSPVVTSVSASNEKKETSAATDEP